MARIYADVASLATKWNKPLSAWLQRIPGKKAEDRTEFEDFTSLIRRCIHCRSTAHFFALHAAFIGGRPVQSRYRGFIQPQVHG
jgi:hypothetical protein